MKTNITSNKSQTPRNWDRSGLPLWTYFNKELFELESEELFRKHWQIVCHSSDIPNKGNYITFDIVGERAIIIRDQKNNIRAFHNFCRHRGSRIVDSVEGKCKKTITCPFHGWAYNIDGTLIGPSNSSTFPALNSKEWGLKPIEMEIWNEFIFIRFKKGPQSSVAELLERFDDEILNYNKGGFSRISPIEITPPEEINWKSIRDVDNEGYHISRAHPSLNDLYGKNYYDEPFINGVSRSYAPFNNGKAKLWSVRKYKKIINHLFSKNRKIPRAWLYVGVFPNFVLGFYPDSIIFYQEIPYSVKKTSIRGATYKRKDEDRTMRLARYLSERIDATAIEEDKQLSLWSYESMKSSAFEGIILSDLEYGVRTYHDTLRKFFQWYVWKTNHPEVLLLKITTLVKLLQKNN